MVLPVPALRRTGETVTAPAIVVGGGPAGAGLAIELAEAGRAVWLIERERAAHDKVCGEFLSYEACHYLNRLGLDPEALGAVPIDGVRLFHGAAESRTKLPFAAWSLSRRVLDEALLRRAQRAGAEIRRGLRVTSLERAGETWQIRTDSRQGFAARDVFLATGKHDLRGLKRPSGRQSDLVGFKLHWRLTPTEAEGLGREVELHLFPGGYAGLEPIEGDRANLALLVRRAVFAKHGGWPDFLNAIYRQAPSLGHRLDGALAAWPRPLAIAGIPYGYLRQESPDGLWRLGDQAAVIPSFAGEGMSIALHSAHLAAYHYLAGHDAAAFQRHLARDVGPQVACATWISRALVRPLGQFAIAALARLRPGLIVRAAGATRIPPEALRGSLPRQNRAAQRPLVDLVGGAAR